MHALGVDHQQNRPDRDNYVTINWRNIRQKIAYNFNKLSNLDATTGGTPYSYRSVMHYGRKVSASLLSNHLSSNRVLLYLAPVNYINLEP